MQQLHDDAQLNDAQQQLQAAAGRPEMATPLAAAGRLWYNTLASHACTQRSVLSVIHV